MRSTGSACSRRPRPSRLASRPKPPPPWSTRRRCWSAPRGRRCSTATCGRLIERDLLLPFLQRQRWFGDKARPARKARFVDWGTLRRSPQPLFLTVVEVEFEDGSPHHYFLPLTICPYEDVRGLEERAPHAVLATITGARKGLLFDAWLDDRFARTHSGRAGPRGADGHEAGRRPRPENGGVRAASRLDRRRAAQSPGCRASRATRQSCTAIG